jgi:hypothetical protein
VSRPPVPVVVGIESRAVPGVTDSGTVGEVTVPVPVPPVLIVPWPVVVPPPIVPDVPPVAGVPPAPDAPPAPGELLCAKAPTEVAARNTTAVSTDSALVIIFTPWLLVSIWAIRFPAPNG